MDKKRRKFLIRQKKKRREKLRKSSGREGVSALTGIEIAKRFKRAGKFVGGEDALEVYFVPADGEMYRIVHDPLHKNDELVQNEQVFEDLTMMRRDLPMTVAPDTPIGDQYIHIKEWSLSFYLDKEQLAKDYWKNHDSRKTLKAKERYELRMGTAMAKYIMTSDFGFMQRDPDANSHLVVAEYEGINLEDFRDKSFGLPPLTDFRDGKE